MRGIDVPSPPGIPTQIIELDQFLFWRGLPLGELVLFSGLRGCGATHVWLRAARQVQKTGNWVAWICGGLDLFPAGFGAKDLDLKNLLVVKTQDQPSKKIFWILQEMISSGLFRLIGCHEWPTDLKVRQIQKLKVLARRYEVTLVFLDHQVKSFLKKSFLWSCSIEFQRDFITIHRALHRPVPFIFSGKVIHEYFMPTLARRATA